MPQDQGPFEIYEHNLDVVWVNNPIAHSTRRAALLAGASELTMLRAIILQMHIESETRQRELVHLSMKARSFDLMTEGIITSDGKRFVFRPKD